MFNITKNEKTEQNRKNAKALKEEHEKERTRKEIKVLEAKGYLAINANDLSDFESKHPDLHKKIYQEGVSAGRETQKRINAAISKDNAKLKNDSIATDQEKERQKDPILWAWEKGPDATALKAEFGGDYTSYKSYFENDEKFKATGKIMVMA